MDLQLSSCLQGSLCTVTADQGSRWASGLTLLSFQSNLQHKSFPESLLQPAQAIQVRYLLLMRCCPPTFPPSPQLVFTQQTRPNCHRCVHAGRTRTTATPAGVAVRAGDVAGGGATATGARSADLGETRCASSTSQRGSVPVRRRTTLIVNGSVLLTTLQVLPLLQPQLLQGQESQSQQPLQLSLYLFYFILFEVCRKGTNAPHLER